MITLYEEPERIAICSEVDPLMIQRINNTIEGIIKDGLIILLDNKWFSATPGHIPTEAP